MTREESWGSLKVRSRKRTRGKRQRFEETGLQWNRASPGSFVGSR